MGLEPTTPCLQSRGAIIRRRSRMSLHVMTVAIQVHEVFGSRLRSPVSAFKLATSSAARIFAARTGYVSPPAALDSFTGPR